MFNVEENVFSHKNAISKNTWKKSSYLPKVGYLINVRDMYSKIDKLFYPKPPAHSTNPKSFFNLFSRLSGTFTLFH
ncbi:predicted protein [Methanosarcina acetivorans C2A]|uniref:Uncharacterized protein n=1 Tax=Methanosarcina acetivorans (strain ATCC 35395 / DSM 2834 / JCM 12185 / C2A) TaxID=188937 RepID=Q8TNA1_METAC|nr:predicted protein [Methanosarcina acetivorans C2A]